MDRKHRTLISVLVVAILVVIGIGGSYAYFTANVSGTESSSTITVSGGTMQITYAGGDDINVANTYPQAAAIVNKTFTVNGTNTTDLTMGYKASLVVTGNTFGYCLISGAVNTSYTTPSACTTATGTWTNPLNYTLNGVNTGGVGTLIPNVTSTAIPTGTETYSLGTGSFPTATSKIHTYTFNIYFPSTAYSQNANQGK